MVSKKKVPQKPAVAIKEYAEILIALKKQIQEAHIKATFAVNKELIRLYWSIGKLQH